MTTWNGERYLAEQIDSILTQTFDDFELLIADDASSDGTVSILQVYAARDNRIRLLKAESNVGLHKNLENALRQTRGDLIAICDQDDVWLSDKLERLLASMKNHSAVYSDSLLIDHAGVPLGATLLQRINVRTPVTGHRAVALLRKNCVSGHALLFRRHILEIALPFRDELVFDQQLAFVAALAGGIGYVDSALVRHRIHGENHTNHGLALTPARDGMDKRGIARIERYRKRRFDLARRLACAQQWLERINEAGGEWLHARVLMSRMIMLSHRLLDFDARWFDLRLFVLLLMMRQQLFYENESNILQRCIRYAKGGQYYRHALRVEDAS